MRALALARLGQLDKAESLATQALESADPRHFLCFHADTLLVLGEILGRGGKTEEAVSALEESVRTSDEKGDTVSTAKAQSMLLELQ